MGRTRRPPQLIHRESSKTSRPSRECIYSTNPWQRPRGRQQQHMPPLPLHGRDAGEGAPPPTKMYRRGRGRAEVCGPGGGEGARAIGGDRWRVYKYLDNLPTDTALYVLLSSCVSRRVHPTRGEEGARRGEGGPARVSREVRDRGEYINACISSSPIVDSGRYLGDGLDAGDCRS